MLKGQEFKATTKFIDVFIFTRPLRIKYSPFPPRETFEVEFFIVLF